MYVPAPPAIEDPSPPTVRPQLCLLLIGVLLWLYGYRLAVHPLTWEEPRRCLVALEMIYRGEYIVPYVLGEPYRNKPPLQNWLIVLLTGNRIDAVGAVPIRLISLLSLVGIAWCLWRFELARRSLAPAWMPVLIFLTMGIVVQYGRSGELDPLFTFWIVAALCCYDAGRRRRAPWLQWCLPQVLLAGGILTKVLAPVFFYPPVLYCAWRDRQQVPVARRPVLVGLAIELALVSAWLIPYAHRSSAASLGQQWTGELLARTPVSSDMAGFVVHLVSFPGEILGALMPWSLVLALGLLPQVRPALRRVGTREPALRLAGAVVLWATGLLWLMPGARGRYLFPALPFVAVLCGHILAWSVAVASPAGPRRITRCLRLLGQPGSAGGAVWLGLALLWGGGLGLMAGVTGAAAPWQPLGVGLIATAAIYAMVRRQQALWLFAPLLLSALLYGIVYVGVSRVLVAQPEERLIRAAHQIAAAIDQPLPVVCDRSVSFRDCFVISRDLRRPLYRHPPGAGTYLLVAAQHYDAPEPRQPLAQVAPLALWRVTRE